MVYFKRFIFVVLSTFFFVAGVLSAEASFSDYLDDVEAQANGRKILPAQKGLLTRAYNTGNYNAKKTEGQINTSHASFNNNRDKLKETWTTKTKKKTWPSTRITEDYEVADNRYKDGVRIETRVIGYTPHHAHHIIPQSYGRASC